MRSSREPLSSSILLAAWILGGQVAAGSPRPHTDPPATATSLTFGETIEVNVVGVDAFVSDREGKPVHGLKKGDFQLFEDGKPVEISNFQELRSRQAGESVAAEPVGAEPGAKPDPAESRAYIAVYFDDSNIKPGRRLPLIRQLRAYLSQHLGANDRVLLASHDISLRIEVPFTNDGAKLGSALELLGSRATRGGQMDRERELALRSMIDLQAVNRDPEKGGVPCGREVKSPIESFARTVREEALSSIHGLQLLVSSLSGVLGRKVLLLVSDGIPVTPGEELNEAFIQLCAGGAITSGAATRDPLTGAGMIGDAPVYDMRGKAEQVYLAPITPLDMQKYSVANEIEALAARANANRVSIYGLQASGAAVLAASSAGVDGEQALLYDIEDNPLEVKIEADPARPGEKELYSVPVRLRIPLFKLGILNRDQTFVGKLRLLVASRTSGGAITPVRQVEVPLSIPQAEVLHALGKYYVYNLTLQLRKGEQKIAVTVRDEVTGTASFLAQALTVGEDQAAAGQVPAPLP